MRRFVGSVLMVGLLVSGCSGDPEPRFEEPHESTPASDPSSATSTPTDEPEPWQERSKAGAVAFAKHWVAVFNEAQQSGETASLRQLSTPRCKSCHGYAEQLDALYGGGGRLESNGWRVVLVSQPPGRLAEKPEVTLRIARSKQRVVTGAGDVQRYPGGKTTYLATLVWQASAWRMDRLVRFA